MGRRRAGECGTDDRTIGFGACEKLVPDVISLLDREHKATPAPAGPLLPTVTAGDESWPTVCSD